MIEFIQRYWIEALFTGIITLFGIYLKRVTSKVSKKVQQYEYLGEGVKALLYDRLRQAYTFHMKNEYITIDEFNYFSKLYSSYKKLGGNSTGTEMLERLKELSPIAPKQ